MKIKYLCLVFSLCCCMACSDAKNSIVSSPGTKNGLAPVRFTGHILRSESRIVGYAKKTGHVGIVDPQQETEIWGAEAPGFDFAVALPDLHGAALFASDRITIYADSDTATFMLNTAYTHTDAASTQPAYSMAAAGDAFEVLRFLNTGAWQQQRFAVPWPANDASAPEPLVTLFNRDGTGLIAFAPLDGKFALYQAADTHSDMLPATEYCAGTGNTGEPFFRSLAWDENSDTLFAGDKNGRVYAIDLTAPCTDYSTRPSIALPLSIPVQQLSVYDAGLLGASLSDGAASKHVLLQYGAGLSALQSYTNDGCLSPLESLAMPPYIILMCAPTSSGLPDAKSDFIDPRDYYVIDMASGAVLRRFVLDKAQSAAVAVDINNHTLYRLREGRFGILDIFDLVSGEYRKNPGIHIQNLLRR